MAAIFELDERLMKSYPIFEAAPNVSFILYSLKVADAKLFCHLGGARRAHQKTHSRIFLMTLAVPMLYYGTTSIITVSSTFHLSTHSFGVPYALPTLLSCDYTATIHTCALYAHRFLLMFFVTNSFIYWMLCIY